MATVTPLSVDQLCWRCKPEDFSFATTDELADLTDAFGQTRAIEAIEFAVGMRRPGYNLYALGPEGIGKHTTIRRHLKAAAALPMTRLMPSHARTPGALDAALMQRAFRIWSAETRKSLEAAALRWNLRWSYRVARGPVTEQLLAQVRERDLLALVATGRQRRSRSGLMALAVAARAPCSVFLLDRLRHAGLPVVVLYEGSPQALAIGRALAESRNSRLIVLALADSAEAAAALQASAQADLKETLDVSALAVGSASQIVKALQLRHPGVVVFQRSGSLAPQTEKAVQAFDGSILALP